jgi:hypothetical protein
MLFTDPFLLWYIFPQKIPSYKTHGSKRKKKKKERKKEDRKVISECLVRDTTGE